MGFELGQRSRSNLFGVKPSLVAVVERAIVLSTTVDWAVVEGVRSAARQAELLADPRKVTDTLRSMHMIQADGFGHAVDLMAVGDLDGDGDVDAQDLVRTWDPELYTEISRTMFAAASELKTKIYWGGQFKRRDGRAWFDGPHFEVRE